MKWSEVIVHQIEQRTTVMYCFVDSWQNSLLLNVAACYQRLNEYVKSIETCNKVGFSSLMLFKFVKYSFVFCDIGILRSQLIWVSYKSLTRWSCLSLSGCPFVCALMWNSAVCVKQVWSDACATHHLHLRFYETLHFSRVFHKEFGAFLRHVPTLSI